MNKFGHFLYEHKLIFLNLFFAGFIVLLDPLKIDFIPDTPEFDYYTGVSIMALLFMEFAGIHYKARWIYSFPGNLNHKTPIYFLLSFIPRILLSAGLAALALSAMGALELSDFFLLPIILYATAKEFWVRSHLFNSERERAKRPSTAIVWITEIGFFIFLCGIYFAFWDVYLMEHERMMYLLMTPINWGFDIAVFLLAVVSLQIPHLYEEWTRSKPRSRKVLAVLSVLLPVLAFTFTLYRFNFLSF